MKICPFADLEQNAQGQWINRQFDDIYYSADGIQESIYVYLEGNQLPKRFAEKSAFQVGDSSKRDAHTFQVGDYTEGGTTTFQVGELGFGTGLNFFLTLDYFFRYAPESAFLHYVSFEGYPIEINALKALQGHWDYDFHPEVEVIRKRFFADYPNNLGGFHRLDLHPRISLLLILGEISETLPELSASVNAWYLDGFNPAKNPICFQEETLKLLAQNSVPNATLSTFSSARAVREALQNAGFKVEKIKGYGKKREMLIAQLTTLPERPPSWLNPPEALPSNSKIAIIGAGIAGLTTAYFLKNRHQMTVFSADTPASAVPVAVPYLQLDAENTPMRRYHLSAWRSAKRFYNALNLKNIRVYDNQWSAEQVQAGEALLAVETEQNGVSWDSYLMETQALLTRLSENLTIQHERAEIQPTKNGWLINGLNFDAVIICTGSENDLLPEILQKALRPVRGQGTIFQTNTPLNAIYCGEKTALPYGEAIYGGASFYPNNADKAVYEQDDEVNRAGISANCPNLGEKVGEFVGIRSASRDYFPLLGAIADTTDVIEKYAKLRQDVKAQKPQNIQYLNGLYVHLGLGSKGYTHAVLNAQILSALLNDEPLPLPKSLLHHLFPTRLILKALARRQI